MEINAEYLGREEVAVDEELDLVEVPQFPSLLDFAKRPDLREMAGEGVTCALTAAGVTSSYLLIRQCACTNDPDQATGYFLGFNVDHPEIPEEVLTTFKAFLAAVEQAATSKS